MKYLGIYLTKEFLYTENYWKLLSHVQLFVTPQTI